MFARRSFGMHEDEQEAVPWVPAAVSVSLGARWLAAGLSTDP